MLQIISGNWYISSQILSMIAPGHIRHQIYSKGRVVSNATNTFFMPHFSSCSVFPPPTLNCSHMYEVWPPQSTTIWLNLSRLRQPYHSLAAQILRSDSHDGSLLATMSSVTSQSLIFSAPIGKTHWEPLNACDWVSWTKCHTILPVLYFQNLYQSWTHTEMQWFPKQLSGWNVCEVVEWHQRWSKRSNTRVWEETKANKSEPDLKQKSVTD